MTVIVTKKKLEQPVIPIINEDALPRYEAHLSPSFLTPFSLTYFFKFLIFLIFFFLYRRAILMEWCQDVIYFPDDGPQWWETEGERAARYFESIARAYLFFCLISKLLEGQNKKNQH
jgi:hypothetical protein